MSTGASEESLVLLYLYLVGTFAGRARIAEDLRLGEGTVRRILQRLSGAGLVEKIRAGSRITRRGTAYVEDFLGRMGVKRLALARVSELEGGLALIALLGSARNPGSHVLKLRDAAVREGAAGAIIALREGRALRLPPGGEDLCDYLRDLCSSISRLAPRSYSAAIIVFGEGFGAPLRGFLGVLSSPYYSLLASGERSLLPEEFFHRLG
ncbi:MAG: DUF4443 domain-containing protein [Thermofilum sp.]